MSTPKFVSKLLIIISFLILFSCENKTEPPRTGFKASETPDQESWNSTVVFSDSGNIKAILYAGHISVFNSKAITIIDSNATVYFYRQNEIVSKLVGKRGKVFDTSKDIEIYDSIVVTNKDGNILQTQKLYWNNKLQKVSSDVYVKITTPTEVVEGIGFESDQSLKNYTIFKVTGTFLK